MAYPCGFSGARLGDIALATLIDIENSTSFEMLRGARDGDLCPTYGGSVHALLNQNSRTHDLRRRGLRSLGAVTHDRPRIAPSLLRPPKSGAFRGPL